MMKPTIRKIKLGEMGAFRATLKHIANEVLDDEQRGELLDWMSARLTSFRTVSSRRGASDFLDGLTQGYEIAAFFVREAQKISLGDHPAEEILHLICVRCNFPVAFSRDCICPVCGKRDMLEST